MFKTIIKQNNYQDSINLMLLTGKVNKIDGVVKSQIMMGTDANKDIFKSSGLLTEEAKKASPNDMVIVLNVEDESVITKAVEEIEGFLNDLSVKKDTSATREVKDLETALEELPDANLALFSIPGEYAAPDMEKALEKGLHVFSFTDNVSKEDEIKLKKLAHEKGLLMMGPDCGTGIISGIPLAFTNVVNPGNIGIVGASGTGIQEVSCIIDRQGGGVIHAIGTGGRDLNDDVKGITVKDSLIALDHHAPTDVIVLISKPPAKEVRDDIVELLHSLSKPVVAIFLGEKPQAHEGDVYLAHTLEECARIAMDLAQEKAVKKNYEIELKNNIQEKVSEKGTVKGLYSGGTLGAEAAMMISEALDLGGLIKEEGYLLNANGYAVMDLGDDIYTQGRPHPMIDPEVRIEKIKEYGGDDNTEVILLDVVLGYGTHPNMAKALIPAIEEARELAKKKDKKLYFIATVVGTRHDPQNYDEAVKTLEDAGVYVESSNAAAIKLSLKLKGMNFHEKDKEVLPYDKKPFDHQISDKVMELLNTKPRIINIGVSSFNDSIETFGGKSVQYTWKPIAGGNKKLIRIIDKLTAMEEIHEANEKVIGKFRDGQPFLMDVVPAKSVIDILNEKTILHAGPPIKFENMTGPMQGSCIGAVLFEEWADTEEEAMELLRSGEINFCPCHHVNAVGPMGGITTGNMPVLVVKNKLDGTVAYCNINEGIGKVLRFGAYSEEVVDRLRWMRDTLGPVLSKALRQKEEGLNLNVLIAKAITMGDEFHQRNIAASQIFLKEIAPLIILSDISEKEKYDVIKFLADTEQFFLNIMMATGKAIVDCARKIEEGTVVTTLCRNGENFGIRIAGMGDQWFTAPVNTPKGLYFTGFSEEDANPDIGDSAITETVGVGGMAMVAAPGVTRFVGAGGFEDAVRVSNEMSEICISHNPNWSIPTWDFKGSCLGIDAIKVVATGITPIINTGIAHKKPGLGQIGAGTVRAPLACFEKALIAYAEKLGIDVE